MNKLKLKKEGEKWVKDGIITEQQLEEILKNYVKKDQSYLLVLFAVLLMGIGILIFIFSDWAQVPHLSRLAIMIFFMLTFYIVGHYYYNKSVDGNRSNADRGWAENRRTYIYGVSFIMLGYIFFGALIFLLLNMYQVNFLSAWPFLIWSIVGLLLYVLYEQTLLFVVALLITIFGQIYSGFAFSSFDYFIFLIYIFGYFHYVFHREKAVFSYVFAIGLSIQLLVLSLAEFDQYYWLLFFLLLMYALGEIIHKTVVKRALVYISLLSVFILKMYESFLLQEEYFIKNIQLEAWFFIILGIVFIATLLLKLRQNESEIINLILFIPFFFVPYSYLFIILSMFVFSIYWLIIGFQKKQDEKIIIGIISFLISTFTVYIQFAWETLNKSLFFLIGGALLFVISFILEKKRRRPEVGGKKR